MISLSRRVPFHVHTALEVLAAPLLMAAPLLFGFPVVVGIVTFALGVLLMGLALTGFGEQERASIPLHAHAGMDTAIATGILLAGAAVGIATGDALATVFMVGFGAAHLALTASTRFSRPLGA